MSLEKIAVAKGDGIGSEIMEAVLSVFNAIKVPLEYEFIDMGRDIFLQGHKLGMTEEARECVEACGVLFKGPMETPKRGGNKSINVTSRKMWSTFANCRRFKYLPGVDTVFSNAGIYVDLTIIRENLEDTYGGIEHLITDDLAISRRIISASGCYNIHKYAFEYAKKQGLNSVVCGHKANIMKLTDGMFLKIFYEVAREYSNIVASDIIVDDLCMKLVTIPDKYQVIVLPNFQGDIVSDLCAGLIGGLGFAPSANIGNNVKIFEAVHGTAPDLVGKNVANPTALLLSGVMLLNDLGLHSYGKRIEMALLEVLKNKIHTADLKITNSPVSTLQYVEHIATIAKTLDVPVVSENALLNKPKIATDSVIKLKYYTKDKIIIEGVDIFIESTDNPEDIAKELSILIKSYKDLFLEAISNRGTRVYPVRSKFTEYINSYTLRFFSENKDISNDFCIELGKKVATLYFVTSIEVLRNYDDEVGYSII